MTGRGVRRGVRVENEGPWYKQKYSRKKYLERGAPREITEADAHELQNWRDLTEDEIRLWEDAKFSVLNKNKKREFMIQCDFEKPQRLQGGYSLQIEVLHVDHRGFVFVAERPVEDDLNKMFWPTAQKLIAHFMSPRTLAPHCPFTASQQTATPEPTEGAEGGSQA